MSDHVRNQNVGFLMMRLIYLSHVLLLLTLVQSCLICPGSVGVLGPGTAHKLALYKTSGKLVQMEHQSVDSHSVSVIQR